MKKLIISTLIIGEMPHWIKKFVNAMEKSSAPKEKRDMTFRGEKISLHMIENVWRESLGGISALRLSKLTDEHFDKNAHSRMRVHLAVQVLSMSVWYMLDDYCRNDQAIGKAYSSLMKIVKCLGMVVDI